MLFRWVGASALASTVLLGGCGRSHEWSEGIDVPTDDGDDDVDEGDEGDVDGGDQGDGNEGDGNEGDVDEGDEGGESGGEDSSDDSTEPEPRSADILFVVDNSGSMGLEQANLVVKLPRLISVLDREGYDYRIGFTTTDTGNPLCTNTTPEFGQLQATSCLDRLDEFVFAGDDNVDLRHMCTDRCFHSGLATTDGKPWIEVHSDGSNLPPGVDLAEAARCFGLQGINGCGLESPLFAMLRTLERSDTTSEHEWGFFRPSSTAVIVFLTDEADCSHNPAHESIFLPSGDRTFWSNPSAPSANSAVCWNAGVVCDGGPGVYDDCRAADKDTSGSIGVEADAAVLHPLDLFHTSLARLSRGRDRLVVAGLVGVPEGYADGSAGLIYADAEDPSYQDAFGIGPGCVSSLTAAVPPVRLREFIAASSQTERSNLHSVCSDDYGPAMAVLGETIVARPEP